MPNITTKEDQDFIARFLDTYKNMSEDSQNLVLAFIKGMEFQRELEANAASARG